MSANNALARSREQTRERLMRSLYRANGRQQAVARRRVMVRQMAWMARWTSGVAMTMSFLVWVGMQAGVLPRWTLVKGDPVHALAPVKQAAEQRCEPAVINQSVINTFPPIGRSEERPTVTATPAKSEPESTSPINSPRP